MKPFWIHSGLALLDVDEHGGLQVTDECLRAYLHRPELALVEESCPAERALHVALLADPRAVVSEAQIDSMLDADVRENWRIFLRLRGRLLGAPNLQAAYVQLFADAQHSGRIDLPPLFADQFAQIIMHHMLAGCEDGLTLRVAELWFREQRVSIDEARVVLADHDTVEGRVTDQGLGSIGRLLAQGNIRARGVDLEMIDQTNAQQYFGRDELHDFAFEITYGRKSSQVFAELLSRWVGHLIGVAVRVTPLSAIDDARWRWHVGLDAQASSLLDKLYLGEGRILLLLRLDFDKLSEQSNEVAGKPVYLALAMDEEGVLRMKPQNLLFNLPVAQQ
ncbi:MAG: DUF6352 family protein [Quisquiliibacterium sp.]